MNLKTTPLDHGPPAVDHREGQRLVLCSLYSEYSSPRILSVRFAAELPSKALHLSPAQHPPVGTDLRPLGPVPPHERRAHEGVQALGPAIHPSSDPDFPDHASFVSCLYLRGDSRSHGRRASAPAWG